MRLPLAHRTAPWSIDRMEEDGVYPMGRRKEGLGYTFVGALSLIVSIASCLCGVFFSIPCFHRGFCTALGEVRRGLWVARGPIYTILIEVYPLLLHGGSALVDSDLSLGQAWKRATALASPEAQEEATQ